MRQQQGDHVAEELDAEMNHEGGTRPQQIFDDHDDGEEQDNEKLDFLIYADHSGGGGGPLEKMVGPLVNVMTKYGSKGRGTAALWFIFGQSIRAYFLLATQILSTIIPFPTNLNDFTQNLTLIGALLYYIGLKHDIDNLDEADKSKEEKEKEDDKPSTSKAKAN
ncbi:hypothetical protein IGI04_003166 [Brassica rapa subsp. trilocularis]|uniref:Uncharacterized protein n=1 Tax=Brassica rapa subsp. trilocularis TaxID=1813537 RepID=A0ABQ7NXM9_BRACM|nr:hypothetical protein IGI04_003166 [Brassica rapa subsp. trilocularis]